MRDIKFKFYYKNKLLDAFTLEEIAEKCKYHWAKDVKVCQYTGLKDKKGKEIYEGDLITRDGKQILVEWKNMINHSDIYDTHDPNVVEIIGNIHQDKTLLK